MADTEDQAPASATPTLSKVRTFADDLERARAAFNESTEAETAAEPAPPKKPTVKNVVPESTPTPEAPVAVPELAAETEESHAALAVPEDAVAGVELIDEDSGFTSVPTEDAAGKPLDFEPRVLKHHRTNSPKDRGPDPLQVSVEKQTGRRRKSLLGDDDERIFDEREATGTVITDTKHKRWKFSRAIANATKSWFGSTTASAKEMLDPMKGKKLVAPSQTRTQVIRHASTDSDIAPTDDHKIVLERLRTLERDAVKTTGKPFTIKKKEEVQTGGWTHVDEDETARQAPVAVPEEKAANTKDQKWEQATSQKMVAPLPNVPHTDTPISDVVVPGQKPTEVAPKPAAETPATDTAPSVPVDDTPIKTTNRVMIAPLPNVPHQEQAPTPKEDVQKIKNVIREVRQQGQAEDGVLHVDADTFTEGRAANLEAPTPESIPVSPVVPEPEPEPTPTPTQTPVIHQAIERPESTPSVVEQLRAQQGLPTTAPKARMRWLVPAIIVTIIVASVAMISAGVLWFVGQNTGSVTVNTIPSLIPTEQQISVPFATSRQALLESLRDGLEAAPSGNTQLYPAATTAGGSEVLATTDEILVALSLRTPGAFTRAITDVTFGANKGSSDDPYLIVKATNFDTAFAGMFNWEPFMSADLAPLFGEPVTRTSDLSARTVDNTTEAVFVDTFINNRHTRILKDENGNERLLYSIINQQTIIITTSRESLERLIERVE